MLTAHPLTNTAGGRECADAPGWLGRLGCELTNATGHLMETMAGLGVLVPVLLALAAVAGGGAVLLRACARMDAAQGAVWLDITPPTNPPAGAAVAVWRVLHGALHQHRRRLFAPAPVLAVEWYADAAGVRAGVWLPAGMPAVQIADAIGRACPGATVRPTHPPVWWRYPARCVELTPTGGPWTPLLDPATRARRGQAGEIGDEGLRAVLGALSERAAGEQASVQLIVSRQRARAGVGGGVGGVLRGVAPALLGGLAGAVAAGLIAVLDLFTASSRSTGHRTGVGHGGPARAVDPVAAAAAKAVALKRAAGPHLLATLRVAATVPMPRGWEQDRAQASEVAGGFDLATPAVWRPVWRRLAVPELLVLHGHGRAPFAITLPEAAVLWHLPAHPDRYHLTNSTAGLHRHPRPVRWTPDPRTTTDPDTGTAAGRASHRQTGGDTRGTNGGAAQPGGAGRRPGRGGQAPAGLARPVPTRPPNRPTGHTRPATAPRPTRARDTWPGTP